MEQLIYASIGESVGGAIAIVLIFLICGIAVFLFKTVNILLWIVYANRKTKFPKRVVNEEMYIPNEASFMPLTLILIFMFLLGLLFAIAKVPINDTLGRILLFGPILTLLLIGLARFFLFSMSDPTNNSKIEQDHKIRLEKIKNITSNIESDTKDNNLDMYRHLWRAQYYLDCIHHLITNDKMTELFQYIELIEKDINYLKNLSIDNKSIIKSLEGLKTELNKTLGIKIKENIEIFKSSKKSYQEKKQSVEQIKKFGEYAIPYLNNSNSGYIETKLWINYTYAVINNKEDIYSKELTEELQKDYTAKEKQEILNIFCAIGSTAKDAIPVIKKYVNDENHKLKQLAEKTISVINDDHIDEDSIIKNKPIEQKKELVKMKCENCGVEILQPTYEKNNGLCAMCVKKK